ncbi:MAG TPA: cisplatin damage response ATP-dependent DNA ligase [Stellaceae bacterium]|nr:cisplatin damage response ATP-dependent DNA ligase [Stellaceae bacterium]
MKRFAEAIEALQRTVEPRARVSLLADYLANAGDPERGWALAIIAGALDIPKVTPAELRALVAERVDPALFAWSHEYVGDLGETVALIWPVETPSENAMPALAEIAEGLLGSTREEARGRLAEWLDGLDPAGRWALLRLATGGLRACASPRLARDALAAWSGVSLERIERVWHGVNPPYLPLFAWLEGRSREPELREHPRFTPFMLATALDERSLESLDPRDWCAEWKWDGIRAELVCSGGARRLYSRLGDDVSGAFPEIGEGVGDDIALDGELLSVRPGEAASREGLRRRVLRSRASASILEECPIVFRAYDLLRLDGADLRTQPFTERRLRLEEWYRATPRTSLDLSPLIPFKAWDELRACRAAEREPGIEGLMLKRADAFYLSGRREGAWLKWKRDAFTADCVLMYAQRGQGEAASFYGDLTFGAWDQRSLVPVGKAFLGCADLKLPEIDRWVRENTVERYGPVREVSPGLVLEIAFEGVASSRRHKSGLTLRSPRIARIRWDKPAEEADTVAALARLAE